MEHGSWRRLSVEVTPRGVSEITIRTAPGRRAEGLELLERALPTLTQLDKLARESTREEVPR
jgi:hypothetical protein